VDPDEEEEDDYRRSINVSVKNFDALSNR